MLQTCVESGIGTGSLIFDPLVVSDTGWFLLGPGTRLLLPTEEGPATEKNIHKYIYIHLCVYMSMSMRMRSVRSPMLSNPDRQQ